MLKIIEWKNSKNNKRILYKKVNKKLTDCSWTIYIQKVLNSK